MTEVVQSTRDLSVVRLKLYAMCASKERNHRMREFRRTGRSAGPTQLAKCLDCGMVVAICEKGVPGTESLRGKAHTHYCPMNKVVEGSETEEE